MAIRFRLTSLGCKVNQYDAAAVGETLECLGLQRVAPNSPAQLAVVCTCCVTATAARKSRQTIRRLARGAEAVLIFGCYGDFEPHRLRKLLADCGIAEHKAFVIGHHDNVKDRLAELAGLLQASDVTSMARPDNQAGSGGPGGRQPCQTATSCGDCSIKSRRMAAVKANVAATRGLASIRHFDDHQRAFVKVQDGCDAFCSYCIVPYTRPLVWSRHADEIVAECMALVAAGHREIVLCGVFLGAFGRDTAIRRRWDTCHNRQLAELIRRLAEIPGLWRLRLSSLEPADVTDDLLKTMSRTPNFAPHLHLPLQSGSDNMLRRMNRQYSAADFASAVRAVRDAFDTPAITTDIIVGFAGETAADFAATLEMAHLAGFSKIHAFPFSPIQRTAAWNWRGERPADSVVRHRMAALAAAEAKLALDFRRQWLGRTVEALVESGPGNRPAATVGSATALSDRYISVSFDPGGRDLTGQLVELRLTDLTAAGMVGVEAT